MDKQAVQREAELTAVNNKLAEVTEELMAKKHIIDMITKVANSQFSVK